MELKEQVAELESLKLKLTETLKQLKIKQAQVLKIKQLKDNISKLNLDIKTIQKEVNEGEK